MARDESLVRMDLLRTISDGDRERAHQLVDEYMEARRDESDRYAIIRQDDTAVLDMMAKGLVEMGAILGRRMANNSMDYTMPSGIPYTVILQEG